ncbi:MAG: homoserine kinase [Bacteroidota bacterium]
MVQYTQLKTQDLTAIIGQYDIGMLQDHKVLSGGSENTSYWVKTSKSEYVITICERKSWEEAERLAKLLVHLQAHDFASSQMVQNNNGQWVSQWKEKPILLKHFIKGIICEQFSDSQLQMIGKQLAQLHRIGCPENIPRKLGYGIEHFEAVNQHAPEAEFSQWLMATQNYLLPFLSDRLPRTLIHADLFYNNIIADPQSDQLTVMDFEEATFYYRIYDIGMTLVGTCHLQHQLDMRSAKVLINAYQKSNSLSPLEKEALPAFVVYAAAATAFWRFVHFNFVEPDKQLGTRYEEMYRLAAKVKAMDPKQFQALFDAD